MTDDNFMTFFLITMIISIIVIVGGGIYLCNITQQQENIWAAKCEQTGGMPSKYHTMIGKTSHDERLCIKKENVIEVD